MDSPEVQVAIIGAISAFVGAAFKYLTDTVKTKDSIIEKRDATIAEANKALLDANRGDVELAALVPQLLKENLEWKQRFESVRKADQ
jgi:hypothetical protein